MSAAAPAARDPASAAILRRNNVTLAGPAGAPTLLLAHGFGCDQKLWRFAAPALAADRRVALFDYVGSGQADGTAYDPVRYGSLEGYATDVVEVADALGLRGAVFVGHSVSGVVGLLAAIRRPELFSRLVLVAPSPRYVDAAPDYRGGFDRATIDGLLDLMEKNPLGWAGFLAPLVMKQPERPELEAELERSFCAMRPEVARQFARVTFLADNRADLARVRTPALILQCADDAVAPVAVGRYMHAQLAGSTYCELPVSGHCPHVTHPAETVRAIRAYLDAPAA